MNKRTLAREWLWALACVLFVFAFYALVLLLGEWLGTGTPPNGWSVFAHEFLVGNFWVCVAALYVIVQLTRTTAWAFRTMRRSG